MTREGNKPQYLSPEYEYIRDCALELGVSHSIALYMHRIGTLQEALLMMSQTYPDGPITTISFEGTPKYPPFEFDVLKDGILIHMDYNTPRSKN